MRRALLAFAVASAAVLGGCNAMTGGTSADRPGTLTPAPVTGGDQPTPASDNLPPGVSPSGSIDPQRVERAHLEYLENRSFTIVRTRRTTGADAVSVRRFRAQFGPSGEHRIRTGGGDLQVYTNRTVRYFSVPNETTGREVSVSPIDEYAVIRRETAGSVAIYLDETADDVDRVRRNGSVFYRLEFRGTDHVPRSRANEVAENGTYRATVYLTPEGLVHTAVVRMTVGSDGRTETTRIRFRRVDNTTVERPGWVRNATVTPGTETG